MSKLLPVDSQIEMENNIAAEPERHPVILGTKGIRKARWSRPGMGKRGGVRVLYYFVFDPATVLFLTIYAKNQKETITDAEKKDLRSIVESFRPTN